MSGFRDTGPKAALLDDGRRLHLQHGPIDLIVEANGRQHEVDAAFRQAGWSFRTLLTGLVEELDVLRRRARSDGIPPRGSVAQRMWRAVSIHADRTFITPMAAVAGAVADHTLAQMTAGRELDRAYVNNGGDISLFLGSGSRFNIGVCQDPRTGAQVSTINLCAEDNIGGVATSGWRGRSHSFGIADAVTVLADCAADADAAATLIANAVDLPGSARITRTPAVLLAPDSDLGERPVTTDVPSLTPGEVAKALDRGCALAEKMLRRGDIVSAFLYLQGTMRTVPDTAELESQSKTKMNRPVMEVANA